MTRSRLILLPVLLLVVGLAALFVTTSGTYTIDTGELVGGVAQADRCLDAGVLTECGQRQNAYYCSRPGVCARAEHFTDVGPFPLLQYLPAWALEKAGAGPKAIVRGLVIISGFAGLALLLLAFELRRIDRRLAALAALCLLAGPLIWYSHSAFGEPLAAAILGSFALALMRRWHPAVIAPLAFAAIIIKDTSLPFVLAIAVVAWRVSARRPSRAEVAAIAGGVVAGLLAIAAFNLFRFGSPLNLFYGASILHTPLRYRPERFVALLFAPNGGLVWFWPAAVVVIVASLVVAVRTAGWTRRLLLEPAVLVLAMLVALLAGFASWFSPFGAQAWGPRLLVPWIVPILLMLITAYGTRLVEMWSRRAPLWVAIWSVVAILSVAHVGVVFDSSRDRHIYPAGATLHELAYRIGLPDKTCPFSFIVQVSQTDYFRCSRHAVWDPPFILGKAMRNVWDREPGPGLLYVLALISLVLLAQPRWIDQLPVSRSRNTTTQRPVANTTST